MFVYEKKLQYPVKIKNPNPALAKFIISQYGGPDGELGASMRYLSQRYSMPYPELKGLLTDIGTEASKMRRFSPTADRAFAVSGSETQEARLQKEPGFLLFCDRAVGFNAAVCSD